MEIRQRPYRFNLSGNVLLYEFFSQEAVGDKNISFDVQIVFKRADAAEFLKILSTPLRFTPLAGIVLADLSSYIDSMLEFDLPPITENDRDYYITGKQSGIFYIEWRVVHSENGPGAWSLQEQEFSRYVLKGGINPFYFRGNNFWVNYWEKGKGLLTWQPLERVVAVDERIYLAWYQSRLFNGLLVLKVQIFYTDDHVEDVQLPMSCEYGKVLFFPVGADQLSLVNIQPQKKILKWEVQIGSKGELSPFEPIAEKYIYHIDNRNDYNRITLNYRNSIGGIDSVRVRGEIEKQADYKMVEGQNIISPSYFSDSRLPAENYFISSSEQTTYKGRLIQLTNDEGDRIRDLFQIREVYWMKNRRWWPVKVLNTNISLGSSNSKRWGIPIEWQIAIDGTRYYTPEAIDLGDAQVTNNICLGTILSIITTVTFNAGIAYASHKMRFLGVLPSEVLLIRWWIPESVPNKQDFWLGTDSEIVTTHPVGQVFTIHMQTVCKNGLEGAVKTKTFSTDQGLSPGGPIIVDPNPGGGVVPKQHRIVNRTSVSTTFVVKDHLLNTIILGEVPANSSIPLPEAIIGMSFVMLMIQFDNIYPAAVTMSTGSFLEKNAVVSDRTATFKGGLTLTNYCEIIFS